MPATRLHDVLTSRRPATPRREIRPGLLAVIPADHLADIERTAEEYALLPRGADAGRLDLLPGGQPCAWPVSRAVWVAECDLSGRVRPGLAAAIRTAPPEVRRGDVTAPGAAVFAALNLI